VPEPEGRDRELDRHRRHVVRLGADLERLAALIEDVRHDRRRADPRQVVGADHPLVVLCHDPARGTEALRRGHGAERVDHAVVEPDERAVDLRDREVLVVTRVGDDCLADLRPARLARQVGARGSALRRALLEVDPVRRVELRRACVAWPVPVQGIEVEGRRAQLHERRRRYVDSLHQRALVEG